VDKNKLISLVDKIKRPLETARRLGGRGEDVVKDMDRSIITWARDGEKASEGKTRALFAELVRIFESTETVFTERVARAANLILELEVVLSGPSAVSETTKDDSAESRTRAKPSKEPKGEKPVRPLKHDTPVKFIKGVGPRRAADFAALGVRTAGDLLRFFPRAYLDRSHLNAVNTLRPGDEVCLEVVIKDINLVKPRPKLTIVEAIGSDNTGSVILKWFNQPWVADNVSPGDRIMVSGKVREYRGMELNVAEYEKLDADAEPESFGAIIPVYPARGSLTQRLIRKVVRNAVDSLADAALDPVPSKILNRCGMPTLAAAIRAIHFPETAGASWVARRRFAFEELLTMEVGLALRYADGRRRTGLVIKAKGALRSRVELPFDLTAAQRRVLAEIDRDLAAPFPMQRLLQGDVGSGKTVVAFLAMLSAVDAGYQAVIMAPTGLLAEQHWRTINDLAAGVGVRCELLTGATPPKVAERIVDELTTGELAMVVGTHSLIQERVLFKRLGLAVIDEQHRFGVVQRGSLGEKGERPNVLVMTATPIPRTLALGLYGDLDISVLDEMPPGRGEVTTIWLFDDRLDRAYAIVRDELAHGRQAYVVYPLVEETEKQELKAATEMFEKLAGGPFADYSVALVHGRMGNDEKERVMRRFRDGTVDVTVATTIIEVGIDVPNATVMLVEHADRYGLAQLHQLRGRVGRGGFSAQCILVSPEEVTGVAKERLETMVSTTDGFFIAEKDLELRGPGELLGTRQHGVPDFALRALFRDRKLLETAREEAFAVVESDPRLEDRVYAVLKEKLVREYADRLNLAEVM
jgi:ATP-dependent DNA helicase RecG